MSRPSRACGLKHIIEQLQVFNEVAPFTGVWIETLVLYFTQEQEQVAPFTGVWIETAFDFLAFFLTGRALHGRVD